MESRLSHSIPTESTPSADLLLEARQDREIPGDEFLQQETLLSVADLETQLNEKSFELEINECEGLQETVSSLKQQLSEALEFRNFNPVTGNSKRYFETHSIQGELPREKENRLSKDSNEGSLLQAQMEIKELIEKVTELTESKEKLELRNQKLAEESSYAKGLASAAAVELKALSEEVAKLMNHNEPIAAELAAQKNSPTQRRTGAANRNGRRDGYIKRHDQGMLNPEIKRELALSRESEHSYEAALAEKDQREAELQRRVEESKQREAYLLTH